ncbi:MAG: MAPEG family protein [Rhodospirillales bacterium]
MVRPPPLPLTAWSPERGRIVLGIAAGIAYTLGILWLGAFVVAAGPVTGDARLAFALPWLMVPGLAVLFGVARVGNARFVGRAPMDGSPPAPGTPEDIDRRYLRNTTEQAVVFLPAFLTLAVLVPDEHLGLVPVLAVSFAVARLAFWAGYQRHPLDRAFGMAATIFPSLAAYAWAAWLWATP